MSTAQALGSHKRACIQAKDASSVGTSDSSSQPLPSQTASPKVSEAVTSGPTVSQLSQPPSSHSSSTSSQTLSSIASSSNSSMPPPPPPESVGHSFTCCGKTYKNKSAFLSHSRSKRHQDLQSQSQQSQSSLESQSQQSQSSQSSLALEISSSSTETSVPSSSAHIKFQVRGTLF